MRINYPENCLEALKHEPDISKLQEAVSLLDTHPRLALDRLENLANIGSTLSMVYLGDALAYGLGGIRDVTKGLDWLSRAADRGSIEGMYRLALINLHRQEYENSISQLNHLCDLKFTPAMYNLGKIYYYGEGVSADINKAKMYWSQAERRGHLIARQKLSFLLMSGRFGLANRLRGLLMWLKLIPGVYFAVSYPKSDRLRYK